MRGKVLAGGASLLALAGVAMAQSGEQDREEIVVTATRTTLPASALPNTIQVIDDAAVSLQSQLTGSTVEIVSTLVPSFSPTREKLSGAGESLRGRSPLFLIDGVPQSNPLRDGSRDGYTIDPFFVERVEVIFGSNAIQGVGATGGVVNYVTASASAPAEGEGWSGKVLAQISAANDFQHDGTGYRAGALAGRDFGVFDLTFGAALQKRGAFYSGDERRVGVDGTQGEVQDSFSFSFYGKAGVDLGPDQRLELMAQRFELEGDGDYVQVSGSRADNLPSTSIPGDPDGVIPTNEVKTVSLTYTDSDLFGGVLTGQVYYQDFEAVFGGGVFGTFQDPAIDPTLMLFDQSANNSEKKGLRFSYEREVAAVPGLRFTAGFDALQDETYQELVATGRNWVPETKFTSLAPFLQLNQSLFDGRAHLSGGVRQEFASFKVDDFTSLYSYGAQQVDGGKPDFEETLFNIGGTVDVVSGLTAYASYAQGFTMPDVGRILRAVDTPDQDVDNFLDVEPVVSDNTEVGLEWRGGPLSASAAYFWSSSQNGARLVFVNDVFEVERQPTKIDGLELSAEWETPLAGLTLSGAYAMLNGRTDTDGDDIIDSDLDGANISPDRLNFAADFVAGPWMFRAQSQFYLDREFDIASPVSFDGYALVDAFIRYTAPFGDITLSASNLFDEQYVAYNSQTTRITDDARFFAGRGRVITLGYEKRF